MLRAFIEQIHVWEKDKQTKTQKIEIQYNFVGAFDFGAAIEKRTPHPKKEKAGSQ